LKPNKHAKYGKPLDLQQRKEYYGGATFWSPRKIREAHFRERTRKRKEEEKKLKKSDAKKLKATTVLLQKKQAEDRRMAQEAAKQEREKEKADKATECQHQQDSRKALELSPIGKRKASKPADPNTAKNKRQKCMGRAADVALFPEAAPKPLLRMPKSGRTIKPKERYE
jgi:hypothetical protein